MSKFRILSAADVTSLLSMDKVISTVDQAYRSKYTGDGEIWPMVYHAFSDESDMDIRSGYLKSQKVFGTKLLSWFGMNAKKNLPELNGAVLLCNSENGQPSGLVEATSLTGLRTGAASAVASHYFSKKNAKTLLVVGSGTQSTFQVLGQLYAVPTIQNVLIYDPIDSSSAKTRVEKLRNDTARFSGITLTAVSNLEEAVRSADIINTVTPSTKPLVYSAWLQPGVHINAVGADMEGKQELDPEIFSKSRVIVDDLEQATTVGETQNALKAGTIDKRKVKEIGKLITENNDLSAVRQEMTVFDTTGIALQDLGTASLALALAEKNHVGQVVEL